MSNTVLEVSDLSVSIRGGVRTHAVQGINLTVGADEIVCVVGESGSGKSMCAHALLGLLPDSVTTESGEILFEGRDLLKLGEDGWREMRGRRIAMVFQEPMTALNPLMRIGDQIVETFEAHDLLTPRQRRERALSLRYWRGGSSGRRLHRRRSITHCPRTSG